MASRGGRPCVRSASRAKSIIMIAFFFTMPISRMMPMIAMMAEVPARDQQAEQRAHAGRRQGREDRDRVDVALVEHAQDDIHRHDRSEDRGTACCAATRGTPGRRPGTGSDRDRHPDLALGLLDRRHGLAEREPGPRLNDSVDGRELAIVVDGQRRLPLLDACDAVERHLLAAGGQDVESGRGTSGPTCSGAPPRARRGIGSTA